MANVKKLGIDNAVYVITDDNAARKSEAIKSITRSGTTFTATRCDGTTFTFTQRDNDTTTGTTYAAGSVPANTTFGTNGSIKNAYDALNSSNLRTIVLSSGVTSHGGHLRQNNKVVTFNCEVSFSTQLNAYTDKTIGTMNDDGSRPTEKIIINGVSSGGALIYGSVGTNGVVTIASTGIVYPADHVYINAAWTK